MSTLLQLHWFSAASAAWTTIEEALSTVPASVQLPGVPQALRSTLPRCADPPPPAIGELDDIQTSVAGVDDLRAQVSRKQEVVKALARQLALLQAAAKRAAEVAQTDHEGATARLEGTSTTAHGRGLKRPRAVPGRASTPGAPAPPSFQQAKLAVETDIAAAIAQDAADELYW